MKGREDNTDGRKRQGQHKRQAQTWTDMYKTDRSGPFLKKVRPGVPEKMEQFINID